MDTQIVNDNGTLLKIDRAPLEIGYAKDEARLEQQGNDAFSPDPDGLVLSRDWQLFVAGEEVPVYAAPITNGGPQSFASLSYAGESGEVRLIARRKENVTSVAILPQSLAIEAEIDGQEIIIPVNKPCKLIVEANDNTERPLFIMLRAEEKGAADPADSKVKYFAPGLHRVSAIELYSGESIYVAGGAVLQLYVPDDEKPIVVSDWANKPNYVDFITACQAEHIRIHGRGIIDMSMLDWHARKAILLDDCRHVAIEGLTIVGTSHWTVHLSKCVDTSVADLMLIGYRENSDGIDIVNSERVEVSNCLIRTGDDAIAVKAMEKPPALGGRDIYVSDCTVWNDKVRCFGIAGETRTDISNVLFENCDIVHSTAVWTEEVGSLCIVVGDRGTISNIHFKNIRIEEEKQHAMICLIFKDRWSVDQEPGQIKNITFSNISIPAGTSSLLQGADAAHIVDGIHIQGLRVGGKAIEKLEEIVLKKNEFVQNITVSS